MFKITDDKIVDRINKRGDLPSHIAIIMDGNGRWAKKRGLPRVAGHHQGVESVREIVEAAGHLNIEIITLYTFSTENWKRPVEEVSALMSLLVRTLRKEVEDLNRNNVRLTAIGRIDQLPDEAQKEFAEGIEITKNNSGLNLNLALNYGSREEIVKGVRQIAFKIKSGELQPDQVDERLLSGYLYTSEISDPDLLIRTSGEFRLSNFLLWQMAYTEIYVTDVLWPDFRKKQFYQAIEDYQKRERRFGRVSEQLTR